MLDKNILPTVLVPNPPYPICSKCKQGTMFPLITPAIIVYAGEKHWMENTATLSWKCDNCNNGVG